MPEEDGSIQDAVATSLVKSEFLLLIYNKDGIAEPNVFTLLSEFEKRPASKVGIVVINSPGGDIYSAVKLVDLIRARWERVIFVVPYQAKSAATLMCLSADEIVMGRLSELGPLDLPYEHPHLEGQKISANDVIRSIERLQSLALKFVIDEAGIRLRREVGLSRFEAVELALRFAKDLLAPIIGKEDPRIYAVCLRIGMIAGIYGAELLQTYMFKDMRPEQRRDLALDTVNSLIADYPDHSFAIRREEARSRRLNLRVKNAEEFSAWGTIWNAYLQLRDIEEDIVRVYNEEELREFKVT